MADRDRSRSREQLRFRVGAVEGRTLALREHLAAMEDRTHALANEVQDQDSLYAAQINQINDELRLDHIVQQEQAVAFNSLSTLAMTTAEGHRRLLERVNLLGEAVTNPALGSPAATMAMNIAAINENMSAQRLARNLLDVVLALENRVEDLERAAAARPGLRGGMQIFIKTLNGKTIVLDVDANNTGHYVKLCIQSMTTYSVNGKLHPGIPPEDQRLMWGKHQLQDDRTLHDYGIQGHATLFLSLRLRGGMPEMAITLEQRVLIGLNRTIARAIKANKNATPLQLHIKSDMGTWIVHATTSDMINDVKQILANKFFVKTGFHLAPDEIQLRAGGVDLMGHFPIRSYQLANNATVFALMGRLRGGASDESPSPFVPTPIAFPEATTCVSHGTCLVQATIYNMQTGATHQFADWFAKETPVAMVMWGLLERGASVHRTLDNLNMLPHIGDAIGLHAVDNVLNVSVLMPKTSHGSLAGEPSYVHVPMPLSPTPLAAGMCHTLTVTLKHSGIEEVVALPFDTSSVNRFSVAQQLAKVVRKYRGWNCNPKEIVLLREDGRPCATKLNVAHAVTAHGPGTLRIGVRFGRSTDYIMVDPLETGSLLKLRIAALIGSIPERVGTFSKAITDNMTMEQAGVVENTTVVINGRLRGGGIDDSDASDFPEEGEEAIYWFLVVAWGLF